MLEWEPAAGRAPDTFCVNVLMQSSTGYLSLPMPTDWSHGLMGLCVERQSTIDLYSLYIIAI